MVIVGKVVYCGCHDDIFFYKFVTVVCFFSLPVPYKLPNLSTPPTTEACWVDMGI
jgi:hypothetical protein